MSRKGVKVSVQHHCHAVRTTEHKDHGGTCQHGASSGILATEKHNPPLAQLPVQGSTTGDSSIPILYTKSHMDAASKRPGYIHSSMCLKEDRARPGPHRWQPSSGWLRRNIHHFSKGFPWAYQGARNSSTLYTTKKFSINICCACS